MIIQRARHTQETSGLALVTVILVLAALLVMVTPFLLTSRNADRASAQLFDRVQAGTALDSARNHARAVLESTHSLHDSTPWFDSVEELQVTNDFAADFLNANDDRGVMWDLRVEDLAGRIDLNSAGVYAMANLLQSTARFSEVVQGDMEELPISGGTLPDQGFVWSRGELIGYTGIEDGNLTGLVRGLGAQFDEDGNSLAGPRPASSHGIGAAVIDQRSFGVVGWRIMDGPFRTFDSYEQLREVDELVLSTEGIGADGFLRMRELGTCYGAGRDGSRWQRPQRLVSGVQGGVTGTIRVDSPRYFNVGSTIEVREGELKEYALIQSVSNNGALRLDRALTNDFRAFEAEVRVLARRPVNINTASKEVLQLLFTNLQIRNRNSRVTAQEAEQLADVIIESRPLAGFEDFLRRVVLPAGGLDDMPQDAAVVPEVFLRGGGAFLDPWDAVAVYTNALNANDFSLEYSTMPVAFTTREVFDLELRAAVNARSGVERFSAVRETVELVVPQRELMSLWARQADFEDALRLTRAAPYWMTGPAATTRFDPAGSIPPSRLWSQLGTYQGQLYLPGVTGNSAQLGDEAPTPERVFPSTEQDDWAQLAPARSDEEGQRQGRVLHFDHETRSTEGRFLYDGSVRRSATDDKVQYAADDDGRARQLWFSMWVKPREVGDACYFDLAGSSVDTDRISLVMEGEDLVLRLRDAGGDHPDTPEQEWSELRFAIAQGEGPGIPVDTWTHLAFDVAGSRPDQMSLFVNGTTHGVRTPGLTRLTASIDMDSSFIPLEDTEGFPPRGVARIGEELIEYVLSGNGLDATYNEVGPMAGFGGRNARVRWSGGDEPIPDNLEDIDLTHEAGTTVQVYGYSLPFTSDVPSGSATLASELGPWRVGVLKGVVGGSETRGDPVAVQLLPPGQTTPVQFPLGWGIGGPESAVTGLILGAAERPDAEDAEADAEVMAAFSPDGGYAAMIQVGVSVGLNDVNETINNVEIGGVEVFRYSGWDGQTLNIAARGDSCTELENLVSDEDVPLGGTRAFLSEWSVSNAEGVLVQTILRRRCFVVPISIPVPGTSEVSGFLAADAENPQFAQLTQQDEGELTEWVCYNWFEPTYQQLVRDDPGALEELRVYLLNNIDEEDINDPQGPGAGGPGGGGPGGGGSAGLPSAKSRAPSVESAALGAQWQPILGEPSDEELPITRGARELFQHRGVLGTYPQEHAAGTQILPVVKVFEGGTDTGNPGRFDPAFVFQGDIAHPGWPMLVHRYHRPATQVLVHGWEQPDTNTVEASDSGVTFSTRTVGQGNATAYIAFDRACPEPLLSFQGAIGGRPIHEMRRVCRVTSFPSGERPREVTQVAIGGSVREGELPVPAALVDELIFGTTEFGKSVIPFELGTADEETFQGGALRLSNDFGEGASYFNVASSWTGEEGNTTAFGQVIRFPQGSFGTPILYLNQLPEDGGLLRIGDEIIAYESRDPESAEITVAPNGRGMLGTTPQPHAHGEPIQFLSHFTVSTLSGGLGGGDSTIPLASTQEFPNEGTVLINEELIHYTRKRSGSLEMPSASTVPGAQDGRGPGLFRGRYGTLAQSHGAGEPVILFPFRYWDRWAQQADAPELSYFSFEVAQPGAWHESLYWQHEDVQTGGPSLRALVRTDASVPWDASPNDTPGLDLYTKGLEGGDTIATGAATDLFEARFFVEYASGSFDAVTGMSHGWKAAPRLSEFGVFYRAPSMTLRSVNR
ncbi:MAG: hypothetical protein MK297_03015 [Planctomycetes bacterium]|nr:hypothetical protein [Planctomycetota bacterium]